MAIPSLSGLTPTYGLGSGSRTGAAILISSPRTKIGSQGRIYAFQKAHGQGPQYICFLLKALNSNVITPCGY
jgi:hypothetical protein